MPKATELLDAHCKTVAVRTCKKQVVFGQREPACTTFRKECEKYESSYVEQTRLAAYRAFQEWSKTVKCSRDPSFRPFQVNLEKTLSVLPPKVAGPRVRKPHPPAIHNGVYTGYRGEDDPWAGIIEERGHDLWPDGKAALTRHGGIEGWLKHITGEKKNCASFIEYCVGSRDHSRPTISTTINNSCGGYDGGYIYKFELDNVDQMLMPQQWLGKGWNDNFQFVIYYERGKSLRDSSIIGINLDVATTEVVFLTKIKPENIVECYDRRNNKMIRW